MTTFAITVAILISFLAGVFITATSIAYILYTHFHYLSTEDTDNGSETKETY